jgi:hypothetical protein
MNASILNRFLEMGIYTSHSEGIRKYEAETSSQSLYSAADDPYLFCPPLLS